MKISNLFEQVRKNVQTYIIIFALVAIWGVFAIGTKGTYFSPQNISNLFRQMTVTSFLAIGMVLVMVTGGIDLSVGKMAGFVSVIVARFQKDVWFAIIPDQPILAAFLSVIVGIIVGILFGSFQSYIIAYLRVPSFIVTLGGQFILSGGILLATQGKTIAANQEGFSVIGQGYFRPPYDWIMGIVVVLILFGLMFLNRRNKVKYGFELKPIIQDIIRTASFSILILVYIFIVNKFNGVPIPVLILAVAAIIMSYISTNTKFGRYAYAIGGNREAARLSGINIKKQIFMIFGLMGLLMRCKWYRPRLLCRLWNDLSRSGIRVGCNRKLCPGRHVNPGWFRDNIWCFGRCIDHDKSEHRFADDECCTRLAICSSWFCFGFSCCN